MGSFLIIYAIFSSLLSSMLVLSSDSYDPRALDSLIHAYAIHRDQSIDRTGILYKVPLPANFTSMTASVVRLRSKAFWARGANFCSFSIPPRVTTVPHAKRIAVVYQNLGNLSSSYYQVPGHSLVSPVVGFSAYDVSNSSNSGKLNLTLRGKPILVSFPELVHKNMTPQCVIFGAGGSVEFRNMTKQNECVTRSSGHFAVAVQSLPDKKDQRLLKWWVEGFVIGFGGLVLLIAIGVISFKLVRKKKIREMEKESEKSVAVDTVWIGRSKMPSASMTRTQPALEHYYVP